MEINLDIKPLEFSVYVLEWIESISILNDRIEKWIKKICNFEKYYSCTEKNINDRKAEVQLVLELWNCQYSSLIRGSLSLSWNKIKTVLKVYFIQKWDIDIK